MTNYEKIMTDMTPEKLTEFIFGGIANACCMCAYRDKQRCGFRCTEGIEKWMKQEAVNRKDGEADD